MPGAGGHVRFGLAVSSSGAFKLTFAMLLIVAALGFTYTGSDSNFPPFELRGVLLRVMAFSGVLLIVALALPWGRGVSNAALALATLAGVFTAYVIHTELSHPSNLVWMIVTLAASLLALFTAFRVIDELRWGGLALMVAAALAVVAAAWPEVGPELQAGLSARGGLIYVGSPVMWTLLALGCTGAALMLYVLARFVPPFRWGGFALLAAASSLAVFVLAMGAEFGEGGSGYYSEGWEDHPNMRSVALKETPNIYFVGFDSIIPVEIMRKYMGIETTDFHRLTERELRRFRNLFANAVPTQYSLGTLMSLDQDIFLESRRAVGPLGYFAGHDLSPLIWLLRQNGYETTSIYNNATFGHTQGAGIDNYIVQRRGALCSLLDTEIRPFAFWGYCWGWVPDPWHAQERLSAGDFIVERLSGVAKQRPQFVIAHLWLPGHTSLRFDYDNKPDRESFVAGYERSSNNAAAYLRRIIDHLGANDPSSILFVYGDHGAFLSQGLDVDDAPVFFLQDRFGILGGVYPRDRCAPELDEAEGKGYMTSLDVVHAIIECLSDGQSPLLEPRHDRFWTPSLREDHSYDYKDFLYE